MCKIFIMQGVYLLEFIKMKISLLLACTPLIVLSQQKQNYKVAIVAFYNCENFYDTVHNPTINDIDFTPEGAYKYNTAIYLDKVKKLATVISQIGTDINRDGPALLGVAEIENDTVLNDLIHQPLLQRRNYQVVHYDSQDPRGIDVALIYNPKYFFVEESKPLFVQLPGHSKYARYTRDILWVRGKLDGEEINILVNHWPSKFGGEDMTASARAAAAAVCKIQLAAINTNNPNAKTILMGDLNDDPTSPSITEVLRAKGRLQDVKEGEIFNPFTELYNKGIGTLAYNDTWSLFDQILVTYSLLDKKQSGFFYFKPFVFNKAFMTENTGLHKGYPMRTWEGFNYRGGYSDHFPTYIVLLKKTK